MPVEFLRLRTVRERVGLSKSEIYRRIGLGKFPAPCAYPGSQRKFWLSTEITDWQTMAMRGGRS